MIALQDIRSLTDFQRNTKSHLRRLKTSGRPEVLTVNGRAELIVQDAAAFEEMLDAIRGIQRGLDEMKAGKANRRARFWIESAPSIKFRARPGEALSGHHPAVGGA